MTHEKLNQMLEKDGVGFVAALITLQDKIIKKCESVRSAQKTYFNMYKAKMSKQDMKDQLVKSKALENDLDKDLKEYAGRVW